MGGMDESEDSQLVDRNMTPGKRTLFVHEGLMQEMHGNVISSKSQRLHGSKGCYAERDGS